MEIVLLIFVPFLGFCGFLIWLSLRLAKRRRLALASFATAHRLSFDWEKFSLADRFADFPCLAQGDNRYAFNRMQGVWRGREMQAFDYHYETHSSNGKNQTTEIHHFSAVILGSDVPLKKLELRPENFLDKIGAFFGHHDIELESAEFNRRFHVAADDKRWAFDVLHARAMQMLLDSPAFSLRFGRDAAIVWRPSTFKPEVFAQAADTLTALLDSLPDWLRKQQTAEN
jgi:hypothetical protein